MNNILQPMRRCRPRLGISLIEVIACTAIVAVMIVPIAGVIRASSQSIAQANGASREVQIRGGLRWLRDAIRDGDVLTLSRRRLVLQTNSGQQVTVQVRSGRLVMDDGRNEIVLLDDVRGIEFQQQVQLLPPRSLIGITIRLSVRDPQSGGVIRRDATVALPPQA